MDGDQVSVRGIYSVEANEEINEYLKSKKHFIDFGGINMRVSTNEAVQSLYCLTKILPQDEKKITEPIF